MADGLHTSRFAAAGLRRRVALPFAQGVRRLVRRGAALLAVALLASCGLPPIIPAQSPLPKTRLIVILVGPSSDTPNPGGLWSLYGGRDVAWDHFLLPEIARVTGLGRENILHYYFSFAGDDESMKGVLARYNWVTDGAPRIMERLKDVLEEADARRIKVALVGWSNGGSTAYEVACMMGKRRPPDLLVTLDPLSRGAKPCPLLSDDKLATPPNWIDVYTSSDAMTRYRSANVIAAVWDPWGERVPSEVASMHRFEGEHGDARRMWAEIVDKDLLYLAWGAGFRQ